MPSRCESTAAKAENQVIGAGPRSPAAIDHRVCMLTVKCQRRPDRGTPWVEVTRRVSQEFHDAFHSAQEDQSDTASDSNSETEHWDDIVAYDTKTSRYTTVADWERRRACDCHRTNTCWCRE